MAKNDCLSAAEFRSLEEKNLCKERTSHIDGCDVCRELLTLRKKAKKVKPNIIEKMPAGRAMDALVAEKVMGWTDVAAFPDGLMGNPEGYDGHIYEVPKYSTEMVDAWKVVERLTKDGCQIILKTHLKPFLYWCEIYRDKHPDWNDPKTKLVHTMKRRRYGEDDFKVWASYVESMPLAICRAALNLAERSERKEA